MKIMGDYDKAMEALRDVGLQPDAIEKVVQTARSLREQGDKSGTRQKDFNLTAAEQQIEGLKATLRDLTEKIAAVDLAKHAAEAVQHERETVQPKQEVFTLDDLQTVMTKAMKEAVQPLYDAMQTEAAQRATIFDQLNQLDTVAKTAAAHVNELAGELPRAIRARAPIGRYDDGKPAETVQLKTEGGANPGDAFGWVSDFLETN